MTDIMKDITPLPWQIKSNYLADDRMTVIGNVDGETHPDGSNTYTFDTITTGFDEFGESCDSAEANAAFIVRAVNSYEALVKAVDEAKPVIEGLLNYKDGLDKELPKAVPAYARIIEAIALAKGEIQ